MGRTRMETDEIWAQRFPDHLHDRRKQTRLIEADLEMPSAELRPPNRGSPASTFEIHPLNFAHFPGQQLFGNN